MAKLPDIQNTLPEIFILESLSKEEEETKTFEGQMLSDMLRLAGKNPKYYYFQSKDELPHIINLFRQSRYRYLHISTHASDKDIATTNDAITYQDFAELFGGHLILRRLFFSACQVGNKSFVEAVAKSNKGMHSILAPTDDIQFDHAAAIWTALYISLFTANENAMKRSDIQERLRAIRQLFPFDFFSRPTMLSATLGDTRQSVPPNAR